MAVRQVSALFATTALSICLAAPAMAQEEDAEIVVTARRVEERLQDVPASITVFNQRQLNNLNAANAADLARFTPGLYANNRFGDDASTFAIRGFTQELRTTPSVGVFFADVVMPRGGGAIAGGDGAGPGSLFDLQNVQVLRGPQGTLFGRNTTGGAVLLVPQRPTDALEGYVEGSVGNYDMQRVQAVLNVPVSENLRLRFGVDQQTRDGYLRNISGIGPDRFGDTDYIAGRASVLWDVTPSIENYTILTYTDSENNGTIAQAFACNPSNPLQGTLCTGGQTPIPPADYHDVYNFMPDAFARMEQWQAINTTTWAVNDSLTIKNILSYGSFESEYQSSVFGVDLNNPFLGPYLFSNAGAHPFAPSIAVDTLVEELQFQGRTFDDRLTWQAGLYYEHAEPDGPSGQQSVSSLACDLDTVTLADPAAFRCDDLVGVLSGGLLPGVLVRQQQELEYTNMALYAQGTFDITDRLAFNLGVRYTWDETEAVVRQIAWTFNGDTVLEAPAPNAFLDPARAVICGDPTLTPTNVPGTLNPNPGDCTRSISQESEAPTWMIGLDYTPTEDLLLYAKYSRGYRQGGIVPYAPPGLQTYDHEEVDTYEIGAKTTFEGRLPGIFNVALFYNDFRDQQIQAGLLAATGTPTTAIVNAGASTIWGAEIESSVEVFEGFRLTLAYTYLNTETEAFSPPTIVCCAPGALVTQPPTYSVAVGQPLPYSPENTISLSASYELPTPHEFGEVTLGASWIYYDEQQAFADMTATGSSPFFKMDSYELLNLSLNWDGMFASRVDGALFVNNLLNEEYATFTSGVWRSGFEARNLGQPLMMGARLRYNFGG